MLLCVPMIDVVSIIKDTATDPTSHNLWPFEVAIAAVFGALIVVPAVLIGLAARWLMARIGTGLSCGSHEEVLRDRTLRSPASSIASLSHAKSANGAQGRN